jgi:O-antigen ligase
VLLLAVPVSLSRGGVVSLAAGLACFVLLRLWVRKGSRLSASGLVGALAGLGAAVLIFVAVLPTEARHRVLTLAGITIDRSGSYRLALWADTLRLAASSPAVGSGFGAYEDALPRFKTTAGRFRVQHAESDHLELLAEGGLLATLLGAGGALALLLLGLKALRSTEHRLARSLLGAALAGGAAVYLHSAFDFNLRIPSNALVAALLAAVCASAVLPATERATAGRRSLRSVAGPGLVAASLLTALATTWIEPRWVPAALSRATTPAYTDLRRSALERDVTAILRQRPARAPAWVHLGWLRFLVSREDGSSLARWGVALDPRHEELARASAPFREIAR